MTSDTEYSYLGRLVVPFTAAGEIDTAALNSLVNGAYAANPSTLQAVYNTTDTAQQIIDSSATGKAVQAITGAIDSGDHRQGRHQVRLQLGLSRG